MLGNSDYCPFLFSRVAEIKALRELPSAAKDRLFPVIACRPWPNANELSRTWEKILEALGSRRFGLDLDAFKYHSDSPKPASTSFDQLFDPTDGFANYFGELIDIEQAVPVLRLEANGLELIADQLAHSGLLGRGAILRIRRNQVQNPIALIDAVAENLDDNFLVVLDAGWTDDLLSSEVWFSPIIERITEYNPGCEIVVTGSSFPSSFTNIDSRGIIPVEERQIYDALVRRHNAATLIYGDWGSTREPSDPIPMKNIPRIDLAAERNWISIRSPKENPEDYEQIAQRALNDPDYPTNLDIWGTYMIRCTAEGLPVCIKSPATAAAVRINMHLYRQSFFGIGNAAGEVDEEYVD